jgi:hypothetical protein
MPDMRGAVDVDNGIMNVGYWDKYPVRVALAGNNTTPF